MSREISGWLNTRRSHCCRTLEAGQLLCCIWRSAKYWLPSGASDHQAGYCQTGTVKGLVGAKADCYSARMNKTDNPFRYFHSSPEVIRLVVLMYVRFPLSLRKVLSKQMHRRLPNWLCGRQDPHHSTFWSFLIYKCSCVIVDPSHFGQLELEVTNQILVSLTVPSLAPITLLSRINYSSFGTANITPGRTKDKDRAVSKDPPVDE